MILITGGTGWLGKTAIKYLLKTLGESSFKKNVIVFGSQDKVVNICQKQIEINALEKINNLKIKKENIYIFHTAFLTKEKISLIGASSYIKKNLEIINCLEKFMNNNPNARIVYTSTGAVNKFLENEDKKNNLYGYLKFIEEQKLSQFKHCLVLRIYGLTGYYIHSPQTYALCDFISNAINNKSIVIRSKGKVIRSYVSAETVIKLSFKWLRSINNTGFIVDATNFRLDLHSLANKISEIIGNVSVVYENNNLDIISDYSSDENNFNRILKNYNVKKLLIDEQLQISIDGFKSSLKAIARI